MGRTVANGNGGRRVRQAECRSVTAAAPHTMARIPELDLRKKPMILFEVFGERTNPRMVPVAVWRAASSSQFTCRQADGATSTASITTRCDVHALSGRSRRRHRHRQAGHVVQAQCAALHTPELPVADPAGSREHREQGHRWESRSSTSRPARPSNPPAADSADADRGRDVGQATIGFRVARGRPHPAPRLDSLDFHADA